MARISATDMRISLLLITVGLTNDAASRSLARDSLYDQPPGRPSGIMIHAVASLQRVLCPIKRQGERPGFDRNILA